MKEEKHPSHDTRISDASTFDEICKKCGATDISGGGWGELENPCPKSWKEQLAKLEDKFPHLFVGSRVNILWKDELGRQKIGFDLMPGVSIEDALIEVASGIKQEKDGTAVEIDLAEQEKNLPRWTLDEFDAFIEAKKKNPSLFKTTEKFEGTGESLDNRKIIEFLRDLREGG